MSHHTATDISDYHAIIKVIQHYIDGARAGKGELMKPAFHPDATIYGHVGDDMFAGPIQGLYDWNDANGSATDVQSVISKIEIVGTVANVRLESDNWTGLRFSDFFNLLKIDGQWLVINKVFHLHDAS